MIKIVESQLVEPTLSNARRLKTTLEYCLDWRLAYLRLGERVGGCMICTVISKLERAFCSGCFSRGCSAANYCQFLADGIVHSCTDKKERKFALLIRKLRGMACAKS